MVATTPEIESLIEKLVTFVLKERRNKAFINWTSEQIEEVLRIDMLEQNLLYAIEDDKILGVIHGTRDIKKNVFHVTNVLAIHRKCFPLFVHTFSIMYPGFTFQGMRYDRLKVYNTEQFKKKVLTTLSRN